MVTWVAIVFVSVMLHELGHAGAGLAFGLEPSIDLHGMGGTTSWATPKALSNLQRVAISLAGPGAGFVAATCVGGSPGCSRPTATSPPRPWGASCSSTWAGVLNLLPMLPLDGGNVMPTLQGITGGRGERAGAVVSSPSRPLRPLALYFRSMWSGPPRPVLRRDQRPGHPSARPASTTPRARPLAQAYEALKGRDGPRVVAVARPVALGAKTDPVRAEALQLLAYGFLLDGRVADADAALAALPRGFPPHADLLEMRARAAA